MMLSGQLSLGQAHGLVITITRTAAFVEQRTASSGCRRSCQSAAKGFQWSFIRRRSVSRLAALIARLKVPQQLNLANQVC